MNSKVKYSIIAGSVLILVLIVIIVGLIINGNGDKTLSTTNNVEEIIKVEKIERSVSGLSVEESQKEVLEAATTLLNLTNIADGDLENTLTAIENKTADFDLEALNTLVDTSSSDEEETINLLQALTTFSFLISDINETDEIEAFLPFNQIIVQEELGLAFVPVTVFTGEPNAFNLLFAWDDGNWKLIPYPLIEQVRMLAYDTE